MFVVDEGMTKRFHLNRPDRAKEVIDALVLAISWPRQADKTRTQGIPMNQIKPRTSTLNSTAKSIFSGDSLIKYPMKKIIILSSILMALAQPGLFAATDASQMITPTYVADWRWVHGAVFVPTNVVNEAQQWDEYDPVINDRELHYASLYGINCVEVYLHYFVYLKKKDALLKNLEDFLNRADKYGIKVGVIFFDDCHHEPSMDILKADYQYPAPVFGSHNSQWLLCPGPEVLSHYDDHRERLKAYVQDVVRPHKDDPRIVFWETYNEPKKKKKGPDLLPLIKDARDWVHETGTKIPVTATGGGSFCGDPYSDFLTWHNYGPTYKFKADPIHALNTECMNRKNQTIPGLISHWKGQTGFMMWEFGIGRDNCRFYWGEKNEKPTTEEHDKPFHGMVFADGHPWAVEDIQAWLGAEAYAKLPVYQVTYFRDTAFKTAAKESITPAIDFDLKDEVGCGSPDTTIHLDKDHYSIRWTGEIASPAAGPATLWVKSDGAVRVSVDGNSVIDKKASAGETSGLVTFTAGKPAKITVEYVHETGPASVHLDWMPPQGQRQILFPVSHPAENARDPKTTSASDSKRALQELTLGS